MSKRSYPVAGFYIEDPKPPSTPSEALQRAGPNDVGLSTMEQSHELDEVIAEALNELSDLERDIVVAAFVEGLSVRQISLLTGVSKSEIHRKLPLLRERLGSLLKSNEAVVSYLGNGG